jgi:GNAT superfamily N-acetyltransferase
MWRRERKLVGPQRPSLQDVEPLNRIFSESFTDRYRRDGMPGVRVPHLNPKVWRFALEGAGQGAMVWREGGEIVAFNIVHCSGNEGWMGPLAVRPDFQGEGLGKQVVTAGIEWLKSRAAVTIGLETMPRTVENVGFYSRLGFRPGHLTVTLSHPPQPGAVRGCTRLSAAPGDGAAECAALTSRLAPGRSYEQEIRLTAQLELGDTTLYRRGGELAGFAVWHAAPLADGRQREDVRVLKLVAADVDAMESVLGGVGDTAAGFGVDRLAVRFQTASAEGYGRLVDSGWQAHWTDLRMTLAGYPEQPTTGIVLSNWEI